MKRGAAQDFADSLVGLSLDSQALPNGGRMEAVVAALKEIYGGVRLKNILVAYLRAMEKFIHQSTLRIEHCGSLSHGAAEEIRSHFEKLLGRKLAIFVGREDSLIAGIRVSFGDVVIENTIACTLNACKKRLCAA
ncbi:MAG: F0F1 ATP synthase subunit delta [Puniceicoccales bacterium]|jgi:hypothetical protein|nr:F0F1 ATP synthase subunit delta [Puniceicoccales bacterium]